MIINDAMACVDIPLPTITQINPYRFESVWICFSHSNKRQLRIAQCHVNDLPCLGPATFPNELCPTMGYTKITKLYNRNMAIDHWIWGTPFSDKPKLHLTLQGNFTLNK